MKKIVLFFGMSLAVLNLIATDEAKNFIQTYNLYKSNILEIQQQIESRQISPDRAAKKEVLEYITFSTFIVKNMTSVDFLPQRSCNSDISCIFKDYLEQLSRNPKFNSNPEIYFINSNEIYKEMISGVSFCFKKPNDVHSLLKLNEQ